MAHSTYAGPDSSLPDDGLHPSNGVIFGKYETDPVNETAMHAMEAIDKHLSDRWGLHLDPYSWDEVAASLENTLALCEVIKADRREVA